MTCFRASFLFLLWCALYSHTDSEMSWHIVDISGELQENIIKCLLIFIEMIIMISFESFCMFISHNEIHSIPGDERVVSSTVDLVGSKHQREDIVKQEVMMDILLSTVTNHEGMWKKTTNENHCSLHGINHCQMKYSQQLRNNRGILIDDDLDDEVLDCGKPVNFTYYDHLVGIQNRASHLHIPEPEVANLFKKKSKKGADVDIDSIERRLKKSKREKPKSVEIYNQIANFWRIKGDTQASIECFRRALAVSPNNAEILLNLARVLFNLQYLDDAIFLTRRSLEVQPPDQNAWQQHFQVDSVNQ